MMLRTGDRMLLAAFAAVLFGAVGGWALLAVLPAKAAPQPTAGAAALAHAGGILSDTKPAAPAPPAAAPPPKAAAKGAPAVPEPVQRAPSAAAQREGTPASDRELRLELEDGTVASFDPASGHLLLRTPFGSLELML